MVGRKTVFAPGLHVHEKNLSLDGLKDNKIKKHNTNVGFRNSEAPSSYGNSNCMFQNLGKKQNDAEIIHEESSNSMDSNSSPNLTI
jgi:hypothetical protein